MPHRPFYAREKTKTHVFVQFEIYSPMTESFTTNDLHLTILQRFKNVAFLLRFSILLYGYSHCSEAQCEHPYFEVHASSRALRTCIKRVPL